MTHLEAVNIMLSFLNQPPTTDVDEQRLEVQNSKTILSETIRIVNIAMDIELETTIANTTVLSDEPMYEDYIVKRSARSLYSRVYGFEDNGLQVVMQEELMALKLLFNSYINSLDDDMHKILSCIGSESLKLSEISDVSRYKELAIRILEYSRKAILSEGFEFNSEIIELSPDTQGKIEIFTNGLLAIDSTDTARELVVRDSKLYDKETHTDVFTGSEELEVVLDAFIDDIPFVIKEYILRNAEYEFASKTSSDMKNITALRERLQLAKIEVIRAESHKIDGNFVDETMVRQ